MTDFDIIIVGAGIAGASVAAALGPHVRVLLLEAESQPGYHATGRSVAFWAESYGGPHVQPLTTASGPFLLNPPPEFSERPLMQKQGALYIGTAGDKDRSENLHKQFAGSSANITPASADMLRRRIPGLNPQWTLGLWEPECCHIDVAALHAGYLRQLRQNGGQLLCNAKLTAAQYKGAQWTIETAAGNFTARRLVNAAGAWADQVANIAGICSIGIKPYRRTAVQIITYPPAPADLPLVLGLDGSFYFKSDGGARVWLSPHDETPSMPCDTAPEEIDVAIALDRFAKAVDWKVIRVEHKWAGLRSFAPDRLPVIGQDTKNEAFFWLAGQGGFGIQTAPAAARLATALLMNEVVQQDDIEPELYNPARFG